MENVHSFVSKSYEKSKTQEKSPLSRSIPVTIVAISVLAPKVLFVICLAILSVLRSVFYLFVPKPLKSIEGQVAAVSVLYFLIEFQSKFEMEKELNFQLTSSMEYRSQAVVMVSVEKFLWS